jgi:hypothetical protein
MVTVDSDCWTDSDYWTLAALDAAAALPINARVAYISNDVVALRAKITEVSAPQGLPQQKGEAV